MSELDRAAEDLRHLRVELDSLTSSQDGILHEAITQMYQADDRISTLTARVVELQETLELVKDDYERTNSIRIKDVDDALNKE